MKEKEVVPEHPIMPCCKKCGAILIGIWETSEGICSGWCRGHIDKNKFGRTFTESEVIAMLSALRQMCAEEIAALHAKFTTPLNDNESTLSSAYEIAEDVVKAIDLIQLIPPLTK